METEDRNACTCKALPLWVMGLSRMANKETIPERKKQIFNSVLKAWKLGQGYTHVGRDFHISKQRILQILIDVLKEIFPDDTNDNMAKRIKFIKTCIQSKKVCEYCKNLESFYSSININFVSGCWMWSGYFWGGTHYGGFRYFKQQKYAHRLSYEIHKGEIPKGLCVCHTCDTPLCVNPEHLWIGTLSDNARDRHKKGRTKSSWAYTRINKIEITKEIAQEIRSKYKPFVYTIKQLAKEYDCSASTIESILYKYGRWKNVF